MSIEERQREEKEQRRQSIIDAAERVLRDKDVEALTMSDVADAARLSRSLLYVYFEDLDDIVLAVTLRGFEALHDRFVEAAAAHERGLMKIRAIGEAYVRFAHEKPVYFDLMARFEARTTDAEE
ncbi:MAG: TetR family transcriptional regulator, partial [Bacteroidetes bacterium]|nr:TetR family transcriptional regulator [Bacteroidota bacterium]